ncbi:MAG: methyltransferase domain-containing protein, partial [Gemmatimonadota bacterium]
MPQSDELARAFVHVQEVFPFTDYVDSIVYHETRSIVEALEPLISPFAGKRLLDIGSGPMDKTAILSLMGFDCCAVDDLADPWHMREGNKAKIIAFSERLGIKFHHQQEGDHSVPFQSASFDVVSLLSVIEHLHVSPREILNTAGEYLKPGGLLVVVMPNSVNLRKRLSVLRGRTNHVPVDQFYACVGTWRGHVR